MNTHQLLKKADDCLATDRHEHAVSICNKILKRDPGCLHALFVMGKCAIAREKYASAAEFFKKILVIDSAQEQVLLEVGNALRLSGDHEAAIPFLHKAILYQESDQHHLELGLALLGDNQVEEAKRSFLNALTFKPSSLRAIKNLGVIARNQGNMEEAERRFQQMIDVDPGYPFAYKELIRFHLENGHPEAALPVCEDCLAVEPYPPAFAMKHIALSELQDKAGCDYIFNPDRLIKRITAKPPENCKDLESFNLRLVEHILNKASLIRDSKSYATINGGHSEVTKLFDSNRKLGQQVRQMIMVGLSEYIENLPDDINHPVNISRPDEVDQLDTWAVVMGQEGHQKEHIHPNSWLSGVYYVQLPDDFDQQENKQAGHIAFGQGHIEMHPLHKPDTVTIKPCVGDLVIFPGYFWHHTIPLQSQQKERISIAFDLVRTKH